MGQLVTQIPRQAHTHPFALHHAHGLPSLLLFYNC